MAEVSEAPFGVEDGKVKLNLANLLFEVSMADTKGRTHADVATAIGVALGQTGRDLHDTDAARLDAVHDAVGEGEINLSMMFGNPVGGGFYLGAMNTVLGRTQGEPA